MKIHSSLITKLLTILLSVAAVLFVTSCDDENPPSIPTIGNLIGSVQTFDDKTASTGDNVGVLITASNLTGQTFTATTNNLGRYTFDDLPFDNYQFEISKDGYGTLRVFGISHVKTSDGSSTNVQNITFGKKSTTTVTKLSFRNFLYNGEVGVSFEFGLSPVPTPSNRAFVRYFLGDFADVSNTKFKAKSDVINFSNLSANTGFTREKLLEMGFTSGQTVFVRMYGESFISNNWEDPTSGLEVFPNINPNTVAAVSFIVPN